MAQVAQVNIEPNGTFQMVPTLGDHTVLLGSVDQLEDKLNRLFTFYKKVWIGSGINAYQVIDCRFDHQVVALKKGLQPIQYTGSFTWPTGDTTLAMPPAVEKIDSVVKETAPKETAIKSDPVKIVIAKTGPAKSKTKVQTKAGKSKPKLNNKPKNNSLNKKNKTAKALMPKKSKSPTKNN